MIEVRQTVYFRSWFAELADEGAKRRINARIDRVAYGLLGDVKPVGDGVSELRVDYGPGYRVYFVQRGREIVILLCAGDKRSQKRDIKDAKSIAKEL